MKGLQEIFMRLITAVSLQTEAPITDVTELPGNLSGLERLDIRITTVDDMPYSGIITENGTIKGTGFAFEILHLVQRHVHFNYTIVLANQSIFGDDKTGIMGLLKNKQVDLAVAFIPMVLDYAKYCTFSAVMDEAEITFMMKRPHGSASGQGILAPFEDKVWLAIFISWSIFGPLMYILIIMRSKLPSRAPENYPFTTCMWFAYAALIKQGTTSEPVTNPSRLIFATWWIFITVLTSFYTANLTAFLTFGKFTLPYNNVKDITDSRQRWTVMEHGTVHTAIEKTYSDILDPLVRSMRHKEHHLIPNHNFEEVLAWIKKDYVFIGDKQLIRRKISDDYYMKDRMDVPEQKRCTLVMLPQNIYTITRAFAFSKDSVLYEILNPYFMDIAERGIVNHMKSLNLTAVNICPLDLKYKERRLKNSDLKMTYQVMGAGFIMAGILFVAEFVWGQMERHDIFVLVNPKWFRSKVDTPVLPMHDEPAEIKKHDIFEYYDDLHRQQKAQKSIINGREYWITTDDNGERRLVPVRSHSALLFQLKNR